MLPVAKWKLRPVPTAVSQLLRQCPLELRSNLSFARNLFATAGGDGPLVGLDVAFG